MSKIKWQSYRCLTYGRLKSYSDFVITTNCNFAQMFLDRHVIGLHTQLAVMALDMASIEQSVDYTHTHLVETLKLCSRLCRAFRAHKLQMMLSSKRPNYICARWFLAISIHVHAAVSNMNTVQMAGSMHFIAGFSFGQFRKSFAVIRRSHSLNECTRGLHKTNKVRVFTFHLNMNVMMRSIREWRFELGFGYIIRIYLILTAVKGSFN